MEVEPILFRANTEQEYVVDEKQMSNMDIPSHFNPSDGSLMASRINHQAESFHS